MERAIPFKRPLIILLSIAGVIGCALGAWDLKQAITFCQNLYNEDTLSLEVEDDIEDDVEDARRSLLTALLTIEPEIQSSSVNEARAAGMRIQDGLRHLRSLNPTNVLRLVDQFERSWYEYARVADETSRHLRERDMAAAIAVDREHAQLSFGSALLRLRALKQALEDRAKIDSSKVDRTLKHSVFGFAEFSVSVFVILAALIKASQDRRRALIALRSTNDALVSAKELEQQRAAILEMVGKHAPLGRTLSAIVELPGKCGMRAGAVVWVANDTDIQLQAAADLPSEVSDVLRTSPLSHKHDPAGQIAEVTRRISALTNRVAFSALDPAVLHDAAGRLTGIIQLFTYDPIGEAIKRVARQMEQLASVAIENTLLYERLAFQAQHDTLTELPNRLLFHDRLQQAIQAGHRNGKNVAVIWIDLDRYKQINDTLGHRVGDELLVEVGRRLKSPLRGTDTVARVGGDEFTILLTDVTQVSDTELVLSKIMQSMAQTMSLGGHLINITASAGVSIYPVHGDDAGTLIRNADLAMYSAKQAGGNQYQIFRADLGASVRRRLEIERELKTALERDEFSLVYQPLMNHDGGIDGFEALLRWVNPVLGEVGPTECIPIAEEMGLIIAIGKWVMRQACVDGASWLRSGYEFTRIAVNISAMQCIDKGFSTMVEDALQDSQLPASKLELEVTETALIRSLDRALVNIERLRKLGVRFAIDDFGTGYSSLGQLRTLPVDCVKIDRSFVKDLEYEGNGCTTLVRGIIALAHNLKLEVVAEGVETEEQLDVLRTLGCDVNQGFFLHRPMSSGAVQSLLRLGPAAASASQGLLSTATSIDSIVAPEGGTSSCPPGDTVLMGAR